MNLDTARTTYAVMLGYWNNFLWELFPRIKTHDLNGREFEQLMYQPRKTAVPASESELPRRYNPSEREIQYNIDLVRRILEEQPRKKEMIIFSLRNQAD